MAQQSTTRRNDVALSAAAQMAANPFAVIGDEEPAVGAERQIGDRRTAGRQGRGGRVAGSDVVEGGCAVARADGQDRRICRIEGECLSPAVGARLVQAGGLQSQDPTRRTCPSDRHRPRRPCSGRCQCRRVGIDCGRSSDSVRTVCPAAEVPEHDTAVLASGCSTASVPSGAMPARFSGELGSGEPRRLSAHPIPPRDAVVARCDEVVRPRWDRRRR